MKPSREQPRELPPGLPRELRRKNLITLGILLGTVAAVYLLFLLRTPVS